MDLGNGLGKTESMKLFITLFYSILFHLCWKRNYLLPYDLPPSSNILFLVQNTGKADKTNNNECSSQNNTSNQ